MTIYLLNLKCNGKCCSYDNENQFKTSTEASDANIKERLKIIFIFGHYCLINFSCDYLNIIIKVQVEEGKRGEDIFLKIIIRMCKN